MTWPIVLALVATASGAPPAVSRAPRVAKDDHVLTLQCRPVVRGKGVELDQLACTVVGDAGVRMTVVLVPPARDRSAELVDPFVKTAKPVPAVSDPNALVDPFAPLISQP